MFDKDRLFDNRWIACGGKKIIQSGEIGSWNFENSSLEAVLVFCGVNMSDDAVWYTFQNSNIHYTCPIENGKVLDVFVIQDNNNINGWPIFLDSSKQPVK